MGADAAAAPGGRRAALRSAGGAGTAAHDDRLGRGHWAQRQPATPGATAAAACAGSHGPPLQGIRCLAILEGYASACLLCREELDEVAMTAGAPRANLRLVAPSSAGSAAAVGGAANTGSGRCAHPRAGLSWWVPALQASGHVTRSTGQQPLVLACVQTGDTCRVTGDPSIMPSTRVQAPAWTTCGAS